MEFHVLFQVAGVGKALSTEFTKDGFVLLRGLHLRGLHPVGLGAVLLQSVIRLAGEVAVALLADHLVPGLLVLLALRLGLEVVGDRAELAAELGLTLDLDPLRLRSDVVLLPHVAGPRLPVQDNDKI